MFVWRRERAIEEKKAYEIGLVKKERMGGVYICVLRQIKQEENTL